MRVAELTRWLAQQGITLWAEGNHLRYRAAKGTLTAQLRRELVEHKEELLAFLREDSGQRVPAPPPLLPIAHGNSVPLSFAQERLWFLEQLEPKSRAYSEPGAIWLRGDLHVELLERSLHEIVRRHETLRSRFTSCDGRPVQTITPTLHLPLPVIDVSGLPEEERMPEARQILSEAARTGLDLHSDAPINCRLLRSGPHEHLFAMTLHHIVTDGWSAQIFLRELGLCYEAFVKDQPSPLPELPVQYADYALWQRQWLQGAALESLLDYWQRQLAGIPAVLDLPTDYQRPALMSSRGGHYTFRLPKALSEELHVLGRREGVTLFMLLLAAFQTLLLRYTGQEDSVVGTQVAGRDYAGLEGLIGLCTNTLVLRTIFSGNPTFREVLASVRETCLGAYEHQDLPFDKLVEALQPERNMSYTPVFQVLFILQRPIVKQASWSELRLESVEVEGGRAKFDLTLEMSEWNTSLTGVVEYRTDLFEEQTIAGMAAHYQHLLEGIVAMPERRVWDVPLLEEEAREELLNRWNSTEVPLPREACLHRLFEVQAQRTPEKVALVYEDEQLTYEVLNGRANQLACYLQHLGVGPEVRVSVYMERAVELLIGLLGILKAGGAYVPTDPSYPAERVDFMLRDAQATIVLTQRRLVPTLANQHLQVVCLDSDWGKIARLDKHTPAVAADNLAYMIYTSGSTGRPKGVQIPHQAVVNFMMAMHKQPGLHADDVLLATTSLSFDIAALELFLPLLVGARLHLLPGELAADGAQLAQRLQHSGATVLQATPTAWRMLLASRWQGSAGLKMLCGGEALPRSLAAELIRRGALLWNMYGPTETTIWSSFQAVQEVSERYAVVPIGRAIANTQLYVLDAHLGLVPPGVAGELYIAGLGLARGYFNRPELTAERFVPHPFSRAQGERLYKTGDRARLHRDGTLEYLGRLDDQVKLRGFRIELGEIEATLLQYGGLQAAVVHQREDVPGHTQLVAYVVPAREEMAREVGTLRTYMLERLPAYMVPSAIVVLSILPLTANGKVDRKALPPPGRVDADLQVRATPPRTPAEKTLATIWAEVLGSERVGIHDNFFALGGESIHSLQMVARAWEAGIRLTVKQLFQYQTIAQLVMVAEIIDVEQAAETDHAAASDLSEVGLSQAALDKIMARMRPGGKNRAKR